MEIVVVLGFVSFEKLTQVINGKNVCYQENILVS